MALMREATVLVFPSVGYQGFPMTLAEAWPRVPPSLRRTSVESPSLSRTVARITLPAGRLRSAGGFVSSWAISHPTELAAIRRAARAEYEAKYTAEANYRQLMAIYQRALEARR